MIPLDGVIKIPPFKYRVQDSSAEFIPIIPPWPDQTERGLA